uniref:Reelin domain-containing protein n=1 Tax=Syphacia muris TaxID=451379 RepID=A0A0N5B1H7_9BILA
MIRLLLIVLFSSFGCVISLLTENAGFSCMTKHSMRLNRAIHGRPQTTSPPFEFYFLDENGKETHYYEPGKSYTGRVYLYLFSIRLIGFIHYRGLIIQSRLASESGYLIGLLKGGRFLETSDWKTYGVRLQVCDKKTLDADSVTHADDSRKFVTQVSWTADRDVGAVQFMITIAVEDEIYWERWRPRSGFILPISLREKPINIANEVFIDEKQAFKNANTN